MKGNEMKRYNEYDLWLSENAGNDIRRILEIKDEIGSAKALYEGNFFNKWKRNIEKYVTALDIIEKSDINICGIYDDEYPYLLKNIYDPPYILYYRGKLPGNSCRMCSIVGSRKSTSYGRKIAVETGKALGRNGVVVVSGMALGADSCAHSGCLDGKGITVAVLGSGVDVCTPVSNRKLMNSILESGGCVLSEYSPGTPGYGSNYPRRNRIISGMTEAVVVIEADLRSGTSITASMALEQGRDVFALPGNINSALSRGTNRLIKEGAIPLTEVADILEAFDIEEDSSRKRRMPEMGTDEMAVYEFIHERGAADLEEICVGTGKTPQETAGIVSVMELKGIVFMNYGKIMIAK